MTSNGIDSLSTIVQELKKADTILIFPHGSIDGDALGSSVALCLGLRSLGKTSYVMMDEDIPENIRFLENNCCCWDLDIMSDPEICICMDNGEISRIFERQELFNKGRATMLIDHHKSSKPFLDFNYIDVNAAASAEIIYDLLQIMEIPLDTKMAESIYAGIVTDTGRFQYSNTTKHTHEIVANLMDHDIDQNKVSVEIYQSMSHAKIRLESSIISTLNIACGGRVAAAYMTKKMLAESGAKDEETEGVVEILRNLRGVDVSVFAKENDKEGIKISMRSKFDFDVSEIASEFGGGGHKKAAGFSRKADIKTVLSETVNAIEEKMV